MRLIIEIRRMINMPNACSHNEHHILHEYKANHADYDLISIITLYLGEEQPPDEDWLIRFLRLLFKDTRTPAMRKKQLLKDEFDMDTTTDIGSADKMRSPRFAQMHCIYRGDKPQA